MKVSQDDTSFSSGGVSDSMSTKLLETRASLVRCPVDVVQVSNLQEQLHLGRQKLHLGRQKLHLSRQKCDELKQRLVTLEQEKSSTKLLEYRARCLVADIQVSILQEQLHLSRQENDELKQLVITFVQKKSDFIEDLSNLEEGCAQLKSEVSDVNNNCESSIVGLKAPVAPRTTQGPVVQPSFVWKSSGDACVRGIHYLESLECPPMTSGVHKWSIFVEEDDTYYAGLGVVSTVHSLNKNVWLGDQQGGWNYHSKGWAIYNNHLVKGNLPKFQKGSKVTFILDLTGEGTLSASVDGKSSHQYFSDMLSVVRIVNPEGGFVPAVSLMHSTTTVRFLGFESVSA